MRHDEIEVITNAIVGKLIREMSNDRIQFIIELNIDSGCFEVVRVNYLTAKQICFEQTSPQPRG